MSGGSHRGARSAPSGCSARSVPARGEPGAVELAPTGPGVLRAGSLRLAAGLAALRARGGSNPPPDDMTPPSLDELVLAAQKPSRYVGCEFGASRRTRQRSASGSPSPSPTPTKSGCRTSASGCSTTGSTTGPRWHASGSSSPGRTWRGCCGSTGCRSSRWSRARRSATSTSLGVTLQFELAYTSVLALLDLSGIPLFTRDRGPGDPVVVGGGPCAYNPEPVADFFDCFAVGDGEDVVHEIADAVLAWKGTRRPAPARSSTASPRSPASTCRRSSRLASTRPPARSSRMEPLKPGYETVVRRVVPDIDVLSTSAYERPVVPFMQTVHDRLPIEIQRGCTRGCRFCQVGMITRPTRQRSPATVLRVAEQGLRASGYEEVGLLSLSSGDYECLNPLLDDFLSRWEGERIALSLPSLRTETMNDSLAKKIAPRSQDRVHPGARGGHRAHAGRHQQGQPRGAPARGGGVHLQERLVAAQALLHDRAPRGTRRGRGGHRPAREALPLGGPPRAAARQGLRLDQPGGEHLRAEAIHPFPVGAHDHAGGDAPAAGPHHRRAGRAQRRHPVQAA